MAASAVARPRRHRLVLIRHAQSAVNPQTPPATWGLSEEGHAGARRLGALGLFDRVRAFYAGPEPKMIQTLEPVATARARLAALPPSALAGVPHDGPPTALAVQTDPAFAETHSEGFLGSDEFIATIRRVLEDPDTAPAPGWETAAAARARFNAAVEELRRRHEPEASGDRILPANLAICTGGRMLSAYLSGLLGWTPQESFERWQALKMPDVALVELDESGAGTVVIPFGTLAI